MNESNDIPPHIPPNQNPNAARPLGDDPAERVEITNVFGTIDAVLRQPRRLMYQLRCANAGRLIGMMLVVAVVCSLMYGVVVGTFSMGSQLWIAPVKIVMGLMISALICVPSLYIFTCLSGAQARLAEVCGLLAGFLLLMTVLLIGFAPVAWIFSQSTDSIAWMGTLHLVFALIAMLFGLRFLSNGFSHSAAKTRSGFNTWAVIFVLVLLQMTTALRPILGKSDDFLPKEKKFFLSHWMDCLHGPENGTRYNR